jgi:hypothetical protein
MRSGWLALIAFVFFADHFATQPGEKIQATLESAWPFACLKRNQLHIESTITAD